MAPSKSKERSGIRGHLIPLVLGTGTRGVFADRLRGDESLKFKHSFLLAG